MTRQILPLPTHRRFNDLTAQRYGLLTVIDYAGKDIVHKWHCICDCGNDCIRSSGSLRSKDTSSCGCEKRRNLSRSAIKHGMSGSPEYTAWSDMKARCYNANTKQHHDWGGRGITVCQRWLDEFLNFMDDMGVRPSAGHSLDRIDNDGNYSPDNCKWSTATEQNNNKRLRNRHLL